MAYRLDQDCVQPVVGPLVPPGPCTIQPVVCPATRLGRRGAEAPPQLNFLSWQPRQQQLLLAAAVAIPSPTACSGDGGTCHGADGIWNWRDQRTRLRLDKVPLGVESSLQVVFFSPLLYSHLPYRGLSLIGLLRLY